MSDEGPPPLPGWQPNDGSGAYPGSNPTPPPGAPGQQPYPDAYGPGAQGPGAYGAFPAGFQPYTPPATVNVLAVVSTVVGVVSMFCCLIGTPIALVCGIVALRQANRETNPASASKPLAIIGIVTGAIGTLAMIAVAIFYIVSLAAAQPR